MAQKELASPEILLLEKLEEVDRALPPALWKQMRQDIVLADSLEASSQTQLPAIRMRRKMFIGDFVAKAVRLPIEVIPAVSPETEQQLYRLHLFCCQRAIHAPEIKRNPFYLAFHALQEMKTALVGMLTAYRLTDPSCPYSWSREFFENALVTDKAADGHTIVNFRRIPPEVIPKAVTEELVTDWLIYRAYDNNGIRTLMDYKNNLLTLPDYKRGGPPAAEFSRFERKMAEQRNREEKHKSQELDLEFRKTLVQSVAHQTAAQMINSGMSASEILAQAFTADLSKLTVQPPAPAIPACSRASDAAALNTPQRNRAINAAEAPAQLSPASPKTVQALPPGHSHGNLQSAVPPAGQNESIPAPFSGKQCCAPAPKKKKSKEPQKSVMDEVISRLLED